jgi:putative FmdB family regulatory protein
MPIYAYRCENCGHAKDVLQKVSDPVLVVCPACGEPTFRKQLTAAGFQLKGSGWYVTDFRGDGTKGKPAPEGGDKAASEKGADTGPAKTDAGKGDSAGASSGSAPSADSGNGSASAGTAPKAEKTPAAAPAPAPASPSGGKSGS